MWFVSPGLQLSAIQSLAHHLTPPPLAGEVRESEGQKREKLESLYLDSLIRGGKLQRCASKAKQGIHVLLSISRQMIVVTWKAGPQSAW